METQRRLIASGVLIVGLAIAMAWIGIAYPSRADLPLIMFFEPVIAIGIGVFAAAVALFDRRAAVVMAFVCATPMWMLVGARPEGVLGAFAFFLAALLPGVAGMVAGVLLAKVGKALAR